MPYYSVTEEDVHEFDEYDPTPYGGGYDIHLTYGQSLAPSEEICYPNSSPDSEEVDYERPQFSSDAEPIAYADDALNAEYSSYARPKPRPGPAYGFTPGGAEGDGGYGGGFSEKPQPDYGFQPDENQPGYGESEVPGSEYGSGYGRKQEYEQPGPESGNDSYGRYESPEPDYGHEYSGKPNYEDEPPRRPSYGRSEEEEYEKPRYERGEDEDEDDNSDEEKKHRHQRRSYYEDE